MEQEFQLKKTVFIEYLVGLNGLSVDEWIFYPGMLFKAEEKWWGKGGVREKAHEGLDLYLFMDRSGRINSLDEKTEIPVMYDGEVVKIDDDFLGSSVFISHGEYDGRGRQLFTIYGHIIPHCGIRRGTRLETGDSFARIAGVEGGKAGIPAHLHISIALIPLSLPCERLNWETVSDRSTVTLIDPLSVMNCRYRLF
jgi:hypothetical protein